MDGGEIFDFYLSDDMSAIRDVNIYKHAFAANTLHDAECRITPDRLTTLFRYYLGGNGTLKEYIDHIMEYGFFTPYSRNLGIHIEP